MAEELKVMDVTPENLFDSACCGIKNIKHKGHIKKSSWMSKYFKKGLKAKVLLTEDNRQAGYIEYIPGQYAWRGVDAGSYMFIHCLWTYYKIHKNRGYGKLLIQAAVDDAKKEKMKGVAVLARKKPWLASSEIFIKNGFEVVDNASPDYELLAIKFDKSVSNPCFKTDWDQKLKKYGQGLVIIRSDQCPHIMKFADEIAEMAEKDYSLHPKIIELKTHKEAQNAPTPFAVFLIIYKGEVIADHQISKTRFKNIMNKLNPYSPLSSG